MEEILEGKFVCNEKYFVFNDTKYYYKEIAHIYWLYSETKVKSGFITTGSYYEAILGIILFDTEDILFEKAGVQLFRTIRDTKKLCEPLVEKHLIFCEKTYQQRMQKLLNQLNTQEYFEYEGCRFFKNGNIEINKRMYNLYTDEILISKDKYVIQFKKKVSTKIEKIKEALSCYSMKLVLDRDVVLPILNNLMDINYSKTGLEKNISGELPLNKKGEIDKKIEANMQSNDNNEDRILSTESTRQVLEGDYLKQKYSQEEVFIKSKLEEILSRKDK